MQDRGFHYRFPLLSHFLVTFRPMASQGQTGYVWTLRDLLSELQITYVLVSTSLILGPIQYFSFEGSGSTVFAGILIEASAGPFLCFC